MDFFSPAYKKLTNGRGYTVYPEFYVRPTKDLMTRGHAFYAVWDPSTGMWSTNEMQVQSIIDTELEVYAEEVRKRFPEETVTVQKVSSYSTKSWTTYNSYIRSLPDNYKELNRSVKFANDEVNRDDYCSIKLSYPMVEARCPNYDRLMSVLYYPEHRKRLEWAIGAIIAGDSKKIQKFIALYGGGGKGKSTFLEIVGMLFEDYSDTVQMNKLVRSDNRFALQTFRENKLVMYDDDGDLSRIESSGIFNSVVSHGKVSVEEKGKTPYTMRIDTFMFIGTNKPIVIEDMNSGMIRRLIDVMPTGEKLDEREYDRVMAAIPFELSGIAWRCLEVYRSLGPSAYSSYSANSMIERTNHFYAFISDNYLDFKRSEYMTLKRVWAMYQNYCELAKITYNKNMLEVKEELKGYYQDYRETMRIDGGQKRKVYLGFKTELFSREIRGLDGESTEVDSDEETQPDSLEYIEPILDLHSTTSELDDILADCPAQYANERETPNYKWENITTTLKEIDTTKIHYVRPPENHIVIDFDLKDENGEKSAELNLKEAAKWPVTYAEFSKGGAGVHLHYIFDGDVEKLSAVYSPGIEIKKFTGKSSLRRKLTYCNEYPVAHLSSGLPLKEEKRKVVNMSRISSEKGLRDMIARNLRKEFHGATKPSVDFIYKILEDAYNGHELVYDVRDMRQDVLAFAARSSHQADYCIKLVGKMKFMSEVEGEPEKANDDDPLVFYDVECFKNLFLICWKQQDTETEKHQCVRMFNPSPSDVEKLIGMKLVGFNSRGYDSHMLYGAYLGYTNEQLYQLSTKLVSDESRTAKFGEAYSIGYTDVHDFASTKQSLKKWEIELGLHHVENQYPWDEPLPKEHWDEVADYCCNDVIATEAVFNHCKGDYLARLILAEIAGMTPNDSTNSLTTRILFGKERHPELVYTDLKTGEQKRVRNTKGENRYAS